MVMADTRPVARLTAILDRCVREAEAGEVRLGPVLAEVRGSGYPFLALLLSLPFIQPLSLGPLGSVGAVAIATLGWQFLRGREHPTLPRRIEGVVVSARIWRLIYRLCRCLDRFAALFCRPRLGRWTSGSRGRTVTGSCILAGGLLILVPLVGIPFNNTLPALMVATAALAHLEGDGALYLAAGVFGVLTIAFFHLVAQGYLAVLGAAAGLIS